MESIIYLLAGLALGLVFFLVYFIRQRRSGQEELTQLTEKLQLLEQENHSLAKEIELLRQGTLKSSELEMELREKLLQSETEGARISTQNKELEGG